MRFVDGILGNLEPEMLPPVPQENAFLQQVQARVSEVLKAQEFETVPYIRFLDKKTIKISSREGVDARFHAGYQEKNNMIIVDEKALTKQLESVTSLQMKTDVAALALVSTFFTKLANFKSTEEFHRKEALSKALAASMHLFDDEVVRRYQAVLETSSNGSPELIETLSLLQPSEHPSHVRQTGFVEMEGQSLYEAGIAADYEYTLGMLGHEEAVAAKKEGEGQASSFGQESLDWLRQKHVDELKTQQRIHQDIQTEYGRCGLR